MARKIPISNLLVTWRAIELHQVISLSDTFHEFYSPKLYQVGVTVSENAKVLLVVEYKRLWLNPTSASSDEHFSRLGIRSTFYNCVSFNNIK